MSFKGDIAFWVVSQPNIDVFCFNMAHFKSCDYTYYRARGLGSDRGPKAEKLERPSPQKYKLFAIPSAQAMKIPFVLSDVGKFIKIFKNLPQKI